MSNRHVSVRKCSLSLSQPQTCEREKNTHTKKQINILLLSCHEPRSYKNLLEKWAVLALQGSEVHYWCGSTNTVKNTASVH